MFMVVHSSTRSVELKKIDKLKDEFGSMVTHELKTPFVPIRGHVDMLRELSGPSGICTQCGSNWPES